LVNSAVIIFGYVGVKWRCRT